MVDFGSVGGTISGLVGKIAYGTIAILFIFLLGGIVFGVAWYVRWNRQFNIKVRIKSKRGSGSDGKPIYKIINDVGGILTDRKNKTRYFRIKGERVDMPTPPFEVMQLQANGTNVIDILQESDEQYYYLLPGEIKKDIVYVDGKAVEVRDSNYRMAEGGDIIWNISRKEQNKKLFDTESLFMKLLPFAIPILMVVGVVFYTYIWLDKAPQIIAAAQQVSQELKEAANALKDIATAQAIGG